MSAEHPRPPKTPRFRQITPLSHDDGSPIPAEWELRCPSCEYDLTGLTDRRCPECGRRFDPNAIWVARRHKLAGVGHHAPAYVVYGVLGALLLISLPALMSYPWTMAPLGILPLYELLAVLLGRDQTETRVTVVGLVVVACILVLLW